MYCSQTKPVFSRNWKKSCGALTQSRFSRQKQLCLTSTMRDNDWLIISFMPYKAQNWQTPDLTQAKSNLVAGGSRRSTLSTVTVSNQEPVLSEVLQVSNPFSGCFSFISKQIQLLSMPAATRQHLAMPSSPFRCMFLTRMRQLRLEDSITNNLPPSPMVFPRMTASSPVCDPMFSTVWFWLTNLDSRQRKWASQVPSLASPLQTTSSLASTISPNPYFVSTQAYLLLMSRGYFGWVAGREHQSWKPWRVAEQSRRERRMAGVGSAMVG